MLILYVIMFQDEPLPLHSAQALHQHLSAEDQKLNDEPLMKKQESKVNEEKLQVIIKINPYEKIRRKKNINFRFRI